MIDFKQRVNLTSKFGFSLAEMLLVLLIMSFLVIGIAPISYKHIIKKKYSKTQEHGRYECFMDYNTNKLTQCTNEVCELVDQCSFKPPKSVSRYQVMAVGGGAGGSNVTPTASSSSSSDPSSTIETYYVEIPTLSKLRALANTYNHPNQLNEFREFTLSNDKLMSDGSKLTDEEITALNKDNWVRDAWNRYAKINIDVYNSDEHAGICPEIDGSDFDNEDLSWWGNEVGHTCTYKYNDSRVETSGLDYNSIWSCGTEEAEKRFRQEQLDKIRNDKGMIIGRDGSVVGSKTGTYVAGTGQDLQQDTSSLVWTGGGQSSESEEADSYTINTAPGGIGGKKTIIASADENIFLWGSKITDNYDDDKEFESNIKLTDPNGNTSQICHLLLSMIGPSYAFDSEFLSGFNASISCGENLFKEYTRLDQDNEQLFAGHTNFEWNGDDWQSTPYSSNPKDELTDAIYNYKVFFVVSGLNVKGKPVNIDGGRIEFKKTGSTSAGTGSSYGIRGENGESISMVLPSLGSNELTINVGQGGAIGNNGSDTTISSNGTVLLTAKGGKANSEQQTGNGLKAKLRKALTSLFHKIVTSYNNLFASNVAELELIGSGGDGAYTVGGGSSTGETISINGETVISTQNDSSSDTGDTSSTCETSLNGNVCSATSGKGGAVVILW